MTGHYVWHVGDLRTGRITRTLDLVDARWSTPFSGSGTIEGSFPLGSGLWPSPRSDAAVGRSFLAVGWLADGADRATLIDAGPLWKSSYDDATKVLQLGASGLWTYWDHRKLVPALVTLFEVSKASLTFTGAQLALIAKRMIQNAQEATAGSLPLVLPSDDALGGKGSARTRTYPSYELGWVGDRLTQLSEVTDGPEIQFVPRYKLGDPRYIEWVVRIGTDATGGLLHQAGAPWLYDYRVVGSQIRKLSVASDGTQMATRTWAAGQGEAEGRPIVFEADHTLEHLGWPLLEAEVQATDSVSDDATLHAHAKELLAGSSRPVETWTLTVSADAVPGVAQLRPGDWITVRVADHSYIPDGDYDMRILSMSGSAGSNDLELQIFERLGAI